MTADEKRSYTSFSGTPAKCPWCQREASDLTETTQAANQPLHLDFYTSPVICPECKGSFEMHRKPVIDFQWSSYGLVEHNPRTVVPDTLIAAFQAAGFEQVVSMSPHPEPMWWQFYDADTHHCVVGLIQRSNCYYIGFPCIPFSPVRFNRDLLTASRELSQELIHKWMDISFKANHPGLVSSDKDKLIREMETRIRQLNILTSLTTALLKHLPNQA